MLEIEFRGKRIDNSEWIYGWLRQTGHQNIEKSNGQYIRTEKYYQIQDEKYNSKFVDEATIGQYTGLKDKNGKKIFEGDILKGTFYGFMAPEYDYIFSVYGDEKEKGFMANYFEPNECEIIGNIYDNPELLKEKL